MPGTIASESPDCARGSVGNPHSGTARRGKSRNSTAASGMPCSSSFAERATGPRNDACVAAEFAGRARTSRVAPISTSAGAPASAASGDWL